MLFPFRQAIVMAAAWTGLVVARGSRRREGIAVVRVPSQQRSFLRMVAREASPGVRSSHRSRPGGAQRSWNDVRRCRAVLAAVPSSPWPPREADQYTAAAGEFVVSLEGPRFASLRRKCRGAPIGAVRGLASESLRPGALVLESVVPADVCEPVDASDSAFAAVAPRTSSAGIHRPGGLGAGRRLPVEPEAGRG
jgi:hypothetical protein